jgi:hypothetical protein
MWRLSCALLCLCLTHCIRGQQRIPINDCSGETGCFRVVGNKSAVTAGRTLLLSVDSDPASEYDWAANVGTFSEPGVYSAPVEPGLVTVTATRKSDPTQVGRLTVPIVALPEVPVIVPGRQKVSAGRDGYVARLQTDASVSRITWRSANAILTSATNLSEVTFRAGSVGIVVLQATVENAAEDAPPSAFALIDVVEEPDQPAQVSAPAVVTKNKDGVFFDVLSPKPGFDYAWVMDVAGVRTDFGALGPSLRIVAPNVPFAIECYPINSAGDIAFAPTRKDVGVADPGLERVMGVAGGTGTADGPQEESRANEVLDVAPDANGDIYFLDGNALRIVRSGNVTTLAGKIDAPSALTSDGVEVEPNGVGTDARFQDLQALTTTSDAVWIAERYESGHSGHCRLRRYDKITSAVTTAFDSPNCGCNLGTRAIGIVSRLASSGSTLFALTGTYYQDVILAIDTAAQPVAASFYSGACGDTSGLVTGVGRLSARYDELAGLSVEGTDVITSTDDGSQRLVRIPAATNAPVTTFGATPLGTAPSAIEALGDDKYFVVDTAGECAVVYDALSGTKARVSGIASNGSDPAFCGLAPLAPSVDDGPFRSFSQGKRGADGLLYFGQRELDESGAGPGVIAINLLGASPEEHYVAGAPHAFDGLIDATFPIAAGARRMTRHPNGITTAGDSWYVAELARARSDQWVGKAEHPSTDAMLTPVIGPTIDVDQFDSVDGPLRYSVFRGATTLTALRSGLLYLSDTTTVKRTTAADFLLTVGDTANAPTAVTRDRVSDTVYVVDDAGLYLVADNGSGGQSLFRVAGSSSYYGFADAERGSDARFQGVFDVAAIGNSVYLADALNHAIRRFDVATSSVSTVVNRAKAESCQQGPLNDVPCSDACIYRPFAITVDRDGDLYVASEQYLYRLRSPDTDACRIDTIVGSLTRGMRFGRSPRLNRIWDMEVMDSGDILLLDKGERAVALLRF